MRLPLLCAALLASTSLAGLASAQISTPRDVGDPLPPHTVFDERGVNLTTGSISPTQAPSLAIPGFEGHPYQRAFAANGWRDTYASSITVVGATYSVSLGLDSENFQLSAGVFSSAQKRGSTLVQTAADTYVYTLSSGVTVTFKTAYTSTLSHVAARATNVSNPDGSTETYHYSVATFCGYANSPCPGFDTESRLQGVEFSNGFALKYSYSNDTAAYNTIGFWLKPNGVKLVNRAIEYCDTAADHCNTVGAWPALTYTSSQAGNQLTDTATDPAGATWTFVRLVRGYWQSIQRPASSSPDTQVAYDSQDRVASVTVDGSQWKYGYALLGSTMTTTVTNPDLIQFKRVSDTTTGQVSSATDENNRTTSFQYDPYGRLTMITSPAGGYRMLTYDNRGNVGQTQVVANDGLATITSSASFPASCSNPRTCNKPDSTTDERGNVTTFSYDAATGFPVSITKPAPSAGGVQPQTHFSYTGFQAYFLNSAGSIVPSGVTTYLLTGTSTCRTSSNCAGTADETGSSFGYGAQTAGTANNLLQISSTIAAGDGTVSETSSMVHDNVGNVSYATDAMGGTTRFLYDADRRVVGSVAPDPDGGGPLHNRAVRTTIDADGNVVKVEQGITTGQSDAAWNSFTALQQIDMQYDGAAHKVRDAVSAGAATLGVTEYSYDALGRRLCMAQRMNPASFSLAPDACAARDAGSFGPDRVTRWTYDAAGELASVINAYGVSGAQRTTAAYTYTNTGEVASLADAKNNVTSFTYDKFNRLSQTIYPSKTTTGQGNSSDYTQLTYDAAGNVISRQLRNGASISYTYDNLNRLTTKTLPAGNANLNASFTYDNFSHVVQAANANAVYNTSTSFTFDALGRKTSETSAVNGAARTRTMQYDAAGRRTRLTWPDGFYVSYEYDAVDELTAVRENGATSGVGVLATLAYDDLGRRTSLSRGNGVATNYGYDALARLTSINHDFAGTADDLTITLGNYNPAGQLGSRTSSNDLYAYSNGNASSAYVANGLNQYASVSGASVAYDPRGNLITLGSQTFSYSAENELALVGTSNRLYYDALHRLADSTSSATQFDWDGDELVGIYDASGNLLRRFVHGAQVDQPLVWYEGSDRRWLHADEKGSIIATSNATGNRQYVNAYDEYGMPKSGNVGRFQYTGQIWLPELGMYYYKARIYSPSLGAFLQTDPAGYGPGPNLYSYVDNDPVNNSDPSGAIKFFDHIKTGADIAQAAIESYFEGSANIHTVLPSFLGGDDITAGIDLHSIGIEKRITACLGFDQLVCGVHFIYSPVGKITLSPSGSLPGAASAPSRQNSQARKDVPVNCNDLDPHAGPVVTATYSATAILVAGITGSIGSFYVPSTGYKGDFFSVGGGGGASLV